MKITYRKLTTGNIAGRCGRYYIFIFKRPHGGYSACVWLPGSFVQWMNGYFAKSLPKLSDAKQWVKNKLK
jgi:hypothetical protein